MRANFSVAVATILLLSLAACGGTKVLVPPRLDLMPYGRVALVTFTVDNAKGTLHEFATQRFLEEMLAAQTVEVLELGEMTWLLDETGRTRYGPTEARFIGEDQGVPLVFVGHLVVSNVKPSASISGIPRVGADVDLSIAVRLLSTESGATVWSRSAEGTAMVGEIAFDGGIPSFGGRDPKDAYGDLVDPLIYEITRDLRPTYQRQ
jgi:hypothetical protein